MSVFLLCVDPLSSDSSLDLPFFLLVCYQQQILAQRCTKSEHRVVEILRESLRQEPGEISVLAFWAPEKFTILKC